MKLVRSAGIDRREPRVIYNSSRSNDRCNQSPQLWKVCSFSIARTTVIYTKAD